ncbi:MAG: Ig-like domain-containing protein, partial [Acidimicrobiia bacterium]
VVIPVLGNDSDPDGDALTVTSVTDPGHGTVVINADGTVTYTPDVDYSGPDSFSYQVCDPNGACDSATVTVDVTPINDPPVANDDLGSTDEDTPVTIPVLGNDTDVDGTVVASTVVVTVDPSNGSVVVNADGSVTYTPDADFSGSDVFSYQVCDDDGACDTATVSVAVNPVNDAPVAVDDTASTLEDTPVVVPVLGNDTDTDGDPLTVIDVTDPANGSVTVNADGTITYTPNADFNGTDTFTYQVCDPDNECDAATVSVTVDPVNDDPIAIDDIGTTPQDTPLTVTASGLLGNDTDPENDPLSVTGATDPPNGSVTVNPDGSFTYAPDPGYVGTDMFDYTISDGNGGTDTATVRILVNPFEAPTAVDDDHTTTEDTPLVVAAPGVLGNDSDPEGDPLVVLSATDPTNGTVAMSPDGSFAYTPDANFTGIDTFTYDACDPTGLCDSATVRVVVTPVNDAPVANDDLGVTLEEVPVVVPVLGNDSDVDGDTLTVADASDPANGSVVINGDGTITYTPDADFNGVDTFTYTISDGNGGTDTATVTVTVNPINDPPVANDDSATTGEDSPVVIPVLGNDSDPDGDALTVTSVTDPGHGTVVINADGTVTYTP